jgi:hypothetical protein
MLPSLRYVRHGGHSVVYLTFAPVMVYLWRSRTGVDNLDKALHHIITVTWGSAAIPSVFQIIAVSLYNSESVRGSLANGGFH